MVKVPSTAQTNWGTIGGILGTAAFAGLNLNTLTGNGCGGGLFGNNGNGNNGNCFVTQNEFQWAQRLDTTESALASEKAQRYTDQVAITAQREALATAEKSHQQILATLDLINRNAINTEKAFAVSQAEMACLRQKQEMETKWLSDKIDMVSINLTKDFQSGLMLESERRSNGDQNLYQYVNATFVPGVLKMPICSVCPVPVAANPQPIPCNCGCSNSGVQG
jgi:hypothetical protein